MKKNTKNIVNLILYNLYCHYRNNKEDSSGHFFTAKIPFLLLFWLNLIPIIGISSIYLGGAGLNSYIFKSKITMLIIALPFYFLLSRFAMSYQDMIATEYSDEDRNRGEIWLTTYVLSTILIFIFGSIFYHALKP